MVTIRDIAKRAGVSVATVSRTIRDPGAVRPVRRARVQQVIEEMNYSPNEIARQLRRRHNQTVIVIVPEIANPFFSNIIQSIENVAHDLGYRVLIGETQGKQERVDYYADMVQTRAADGLILLGSLLPSVVAASLSKGGGSPIPLVLACERFDGLDCPTVMIDNFAAAHTAVQHLVSRGCTRLAMIAGPPENLLSTDRTRGFVAALMEADLPLIQSQIEHGDFSIESGYIAMQQLLAANPAPDGLFCANDEMAIGAQKAIREYGYAMPDDIGIVGFDDLRFGNFTVPPLTTIRQPTAALGATAMTLLDARLKDTPIICPKVVLPYELIERDSSACQR